MTTGILLFAHGSRDPNWKRPFESILAQTQEQASGPVALAFLESMQPDFAQGIASLVGNGANAIGEAAVIQHAIARYASSAV